MGAYRQTLRRHRTLLTMPIIVSALIAAWLSFGSSSTYRSVANLWIDDGSSPSAESSVEADQVASNPVVPSGPAALESQVLSELLYTPAFDQAVASGSQLPAFLQSGGGTSRFSPSALISGGGDPIPADVALNDATGSVGYNVTGDTAGPQIMRVSYTGPSPTVAQSVLRSLIRELQVATTRFSASIDRTSAAFYHASVLAATSLAANSGGALARYAHSHPDASSTNDPDYRALDNEAQLAETQLKVAQAAATADTDAEQEGLGPTIAVVDQPTLPRAPVTGLAAKLAGLIAGAFAGVVVTLLALIALTPRPRIRWDAEMPALERFSVSPRRSSETRRASSSGSVGPPASLRPRTPPRHEGR